MNKNCVLKCIMRSLACLMCIISFTACQKDQSLKIVEKFIYVQINCETYQMAKGDEEKLKEIFLEFFEEEDYQKYLDDVFGYMYPQLFYITNASQSKIQKVKCKEMKKLEEDARQYLLEVDYTIIPEKQKGKKISNVTMTDLFQVTISKENKIQQVVILNTSDIIKKLILDVKVQ